MAEILSNHCYGETPMRSLMLALALAAPVSAVAASPTYTNPLTTRGADWRCAVQDSVRLDTAGLCAGRQHCPDLQLAERKNFWPGIDAGVGE
jgi:hypothetical protein